MWTRFNFFLTVEVALFASLGYVVFGGDIDNQRAALASGITGLVISLLWLHVGAQDRHLVEAYRSDVAGMDRDV